MIRLLRDNDDYYNQSDDVVVVDRKMYAFI